MILLVIWLTCANDGLIFADARFHKIFKLFNGFGVLQILNENINTEFH
jgi:hypothetical protein